MLVLALGAGTLALLRGPLRGKAPSNPARATTLAARSGGSPASGAVTTGAKTRTTTASALPSLIVPSGGAEPTHAAPPAPAKAKPAAAAPPAVKPRAHEPEEAPPAPEPAPRAAIARATSNVSKISKSSSNNHKHAESKPRAVASHATRHASTSSPSSRGGSHRRTSASAAERGDSSASSESDRMARARAAYREGNEKLFSGDAAGAITAYEEMVRLNPKDPAGYRGLGLASAQLGKRTEAVRYLRAYLKHAPDADDRAIIIGRISLLQTLP